MTEYTFGTAFSGHATICAPDGGDWPVAGRQRGGKPRDPYIREKFTATSRSPGTWRENTSSASQRANTRLRWRAGPDPISEYRVHHEAASRAGRTALMKFRTPPQ